MSKTGRSCSPIGENVTIAAPSYSVPLGGASPKSVSSSAAVVNGRALNSAHESTAVGSTPASENFSA